MGPSAEPNAVIQTEIWAGTGLRYEVCFTQQGVPDNAEAFDR
jgi:hypothetical protein